MAIITRAGELVDCGTIGALFLKSGPADLAAQISGAAGDPVLREKIGASAMAV